MILKIQFSIKSFFEQFLSLAFLSEFVHLSPLCTRCVTIGCISGISVTRN